MTPTAPHYLLYAESLPVQTVDRRAASGWRFILQAAEGSHRIEAADTEPHLFGERLELLALVRGLEALDQPSRVTVITSSRYVRLGLAYGLEEWRANAWRWEWHGQWVPVKNCDLWQRIDRTLQFHQLECRTWRADVAHAALPHTAQGRPALGPPPDPPRRDGLRRLLAPWRRSPRLAAAT